MASELSQPTPSQQTRHGRGILFLKWGAFDELLNRALDSVRAVHPELPVHVAQLPEGTSVVEKSAMFDLSPFEETLYLDADTVVLDRLDFGFAMAQRHGLACVIGDCPWARRYAGLSEDGDVVDYDTGVIFFTGQARPVFEAWQAGKGIDSSYRMVPPLRREVVEVAADDQASFSAALSRAKRPPFVLPMNWNFRPRTQRTWWGPIKVWHDRAAPPSTLGAITREQSREESIIRYLKFNG